MTDINYYVSDLDCKFYFHTNMKETVKDFLIFSGFSIEDEKENKFESDSATFIFSDKINLDNSIYCGNMIKR